MKFAKVFLSALAVFALTAASASADVLPNPKPRVPKPVVQTERPRPILQGQNAYQQRLPLHGNTESKIYHAPDCEYYNSKAATAEFATARQAEAAGYRACKVCEGKEGVAPTKKQFPSSAKQLHGNPDSKVLHGPSCKYYDSKSSSERFASVEQAKKQGYHLCTLCGGK